MNRNGSFATSIAAVSAAVVLWCCQCNTGSSQSDINVEEKTPRRESTNFLFQCVGCTNDFYLPKALAEVCAVRGDCIGYNDTLAMVDKMVSSASASEVMIGKCGQYQFIMFSDHYSSGWTRLFDSNGELVSMLLRADTIGFCKYRALFECYGKSVRCYPSVEYHIGVEEGEY